MGDPQGVRNISSLIKKKRAMHGDSWLILSKMFEVAYSNVNLNRLFETGFFTLWFMVLFKLCRLIYNPHNKENWLDIQGYAELALLDIEEHNGTESDVSSE